MSGGSGEALGLIAGEGVFPLDVARCARRAGRRLVCVALHDRTDTRIEKLASEVTWIRPGEVSAAVEALRAAGVEEAVMAGKVPKLALLQEDPELGLDRQGEALISELSDRMDDTILARVADFLADVGIRLLPQWSFSPELLAGEGTLGRVKASAAQQRDIAFAFPIARQLGALDIGQTVVVKDGAVLAVEAIEGTDAALRRGGALTAGAVAVKVAKPGQDSRFDVPAIGRETVAVLAEAGLSALAFEAGATLVLEHEELVACADAHGIAVLGVTADGLERST
jgi:DUF1009 family protein